MSELHDVRKRIQKRRNDEPREHTTFFKLFYRMIMLVMSVVVLVLAFFINNKMGIVEIPQDLKNINFGLISEWLPFENWFETNHKDETVNATPNYHLLKENHYVNGSNQAHMLLHGVVLHVEEGEGKKSSVTIRHDNGVIATYGHLDQVHVKQDERLLKGNILGTFSEYISIDFVKQNQPIDLNTAMGGS